MQRKLYWMIAIVAVLLAACSTTQETSEAPEKLLFSDRQMAVLVFTEGAFSKLERSQGTGKALQGYSAVDNTFGGRDHPVLVHTATMLKYRGPVDTCTLTIDRRIHCEKSGSGTWDYHDG